MPFSLGSKVSLKSTAARPASEATLYGFTNIEDHEDLSNLDAPLTYVEPVDSGGIFTNKLVAISKTDIVDLYFIGKGDTGACFSETAAECREGCLLARDGCECSNCSNADPPQVCTGCNCAVTCTCTGHGTYATGGTGIPYYVRLDFSSVSEKVWSSKQPGYISIEQFTESADETLRSMEVEVGIVGDPSTTNILYTEADTLQGGVVYTAYRCLNASCNKCNDCAIEVPGYGTTINSQIALSNGLNATITVQAYGDPISDGTLESILYSDFGWSGMTGVTWDYYGTGGTGCYVSRSPCSGPGLAGGFVCGGANDPGNFRKGRFLGVAINPTFEP